MNIKECVDFINFWIRKERGAFYTIEESVEVIDRGQLAYYNDIIPKYATSQIIKDTLAPFREKYIFAPGDTPSGLITIPDTQYLDLLSVQIEFTEDGRDVYYPIKMENEDEMGDRLNSQIDPVKVSAPVGEMVGSRKIQLYPKVNIYTGTLSYMRRPVKPVYNYTVVGGRVIVYNPVGSVQLEWRDVDIDAILLKGLASIGINLSDQEVSQFAQAKSQENYQGVNHL